MEQNVQQICEVGLATLFSEVDKVVNERAIATCVELTYKALLHRASGMNCVVANVTQTISTESVMIGGLQQITFIVTLVGTVVDAELVKQQQRLQQFDPRMMKNHRSN